MSITYKQIVLEHQWNHRYIGLRIREGSQPTECRTSKACALIVTLIGNCHMTSLPRYDDAETKVLEKKNADLTDLGFFLTHKVYSWYTSEQACKGKKGQLASLWSKNLVESAKMLSFDAHKLLHSGVYIAIGLRLKGVLCIFDVEW